MKDFFKYVFASMTGFLLAQTVMVFGWLFLGGLAIGIIAATSSSTPKVEVKPEESKILALNLSGRVVERVEIQDLFMDESFGVSSDEAPLGLFELERTLRAAEKDETVQSLFVRVGFLRGGWASLTSIREALEKFKSSGKKVYAYAEYYTEGTYYIASVADTVFMYPEGSMQLNGFATVLSFFKGTLEKLEVEPQIFRAGSYKSAIEPFLRENMSEKNREQILAYSRDLWTYFAKSIAESRQLEEADINRYADRLLVNSAEEAKKASLVDELKFEDEVIDFLKGTLGIEEDKDLPLISARRYMRSPKSGKSFGGAEDFIQLRSDLDEDDAKIAIIFASGEIHMGSGDEESIGSTTYMRALRDARKDDSVKAVVLRINSPGGQALAADMIWREVELTNRVKPVIASFGDVAASGGYYFAAGARKIFAQPTTLTGSIGVFGLGFVAKNMFKNKMGITFDQVVTHPSADMGMTHRKMNESEAFVVGKEIDRIYDRFLYVVEKGRKMSNEEVKPLAGGRVWSGWGAKHNKLVDEMGGLQEAILAAAAAANLGEDEYNLQALPKPRLPFGRLFQYLSVQVKDMMGMPTVQLPKMLKDIEKQPYQQRIFTLMPAQITVN